MKFCVYCGSTLNDNEICSCQQEAPNQAEETSSGAETPQMPPIPSPADTASPTPNAQQPQQPYPPYAQNPPPYPPPYHPPPYPPNAYPQQQYPYPPNGYPYPYPYPYQPTPPKKIEPGRTMIKVTGILMTIIGGILLMGKLAELDSAMRPDYGYGENVAAFSGGGVSGVWVFEMLIALLMLGFGIAGIVFSKDRSKASVISIFGVTLVLLLVIDFIWSVISVSNSFASFYEFSYFFDLIFSCVLPILYIVGGVVRKKGARDTKF